MVARGLNSARSYGKKVEVYICLRRGILEGKNAFTFVFLEVALPAAKDAVRTNCPRNICGHAGEPRVRQKQVLLACSSHYPVSRMMCPCSSSSSGVLSIAPGREVCALLVECQCLSFVGNPQLQSPASLPRPPTLWSTQVWSSRSVAGQFYRYFVDSR